MDSAAGRNLVAGSGISAATYMSLHTADPAGTGANEVSGGSPAYARVAITWDAGDGTGKFTATLAQPFDMPPATTVTHVGLWNAATAGTYIDKAACSATSVNQEQLSISSITFTEA